MAAESDQLVIPHAARGSNQLTSDVTTVTTRVTRLPSTSNVVCDGKAMNAGIATGSRDDGVTSQGGESCRGVGNVGRNVFTPISTSSAASQNSTLAVRHNTCVVQLDGRKYTISNDVIGFCAIV